MYIYITNYSLSLKKEGSKGHDCVTPCCERIHMFLIAISNKDIRGTFREKKEQMRKKYLHTCNVEQIFS